MFYRSDLNNGDWLMVNVRNCFPLTINQSPFTIQMIIARILGTVVATQKDERLHGKKLLIVKPINLDGTDQSGYLVAVDTVGAGFHEKVLIVGGSSARLAEGNKDCPVDSAIVGVIDSFEVNDK
jgi:microcompartment protein CcmK/EutM